MPKFKQALGIRAELKMHDPGIPATKLDWANLFPDWLLAHTFEKTANSPPCAFIREKGHQLVESTPLRRAARDRPELENAEKFSALDFLTERAEANPPLRVHWDSAIAHLGSFGPFAVGAEFSPHHAVARHEGIGDLLRRVTFDIQFGEWSWSLEIPVLQDSFGSEDRSGSEDQGRGDTATRQGHAAPRAGKMGG